MEIRLLTPLVLSQYASNDINVEIRGNTVGDLLSEIEEQYPALYNCVCDETGQLRPHINLFVGNELLSRDDFKAKLRSGDVVSVFQSVSGG